MARSGLVLSGGGARGAYEAGVVSGIVEVLGLGPDDPAPFDIFAGSSVGAINAVWLAAHADRGDLHARGLVDVWRSLRLNSHLRLSRPRWRDVLRLGWARSLLDPGPLDRLIAGSVPWDRLHANVDSGVVHALVVAALRISNGRTTMFAELSPDAVFRPSQDPRRVVNRVRVGPLHVLASAAIPFIFPVRRIGPAWFCDGGLRFNTPMAPAIRAGAERLVVVSLLHEGSGAPPADDEAHPSWFFLAGKVLNALLLDPIDYDLHVLARFNRLLEALEQALTPEEATRVDAEMRAVRGMAYRRLETLVFRPSADLGELAGRHLREQRTGMGWLSDRLLRRAADSNATWEDDLASFVLFDGGYAERLVELGRQDAHARADEVRAFLGSAPE